jgi:hypothetical protein
MNPRNLLVAVAAVLVLGVTFNLRSQGLTDGIKVTLPEPVTVGDVVLEPGEYEIRRASMHQDQVLRFFNNDKLRHETTVLTVPTFDREAPEESKVVLHHIGDKYYFDKIWMEGKNYGYEFVLPDRVRALQKELSVSVPARYEAVQQTSVETSIPAHADTQSVAVAEQDKDSVQDKERADAAALAAEASAERERQAQLDREREEQLARDREAELERNRVAALQQEQAPISPSPADTRAESPSVGIQDNAQESQELPATASDWFAYMLGGCLLLAMAGFFRKTRTQE